MKELIDEPLFDTICFFSCQERQERYFFQWPIGTQVALITNGKVTATIKKWSHTNMIQAGRLLAEEFAVTGFSVYFMPIIHQDVDLILDFLADSSFEFRIANRSCFTVPTILIPCYLHRRIPSDQPLQLLVPPDAGALEAVVFSDVHPEDLKIPLVIQHDTPFLVKMTTPPLLRPMNVMVFLHGTRERSTE